MKVTNLVSVYQGLEVLSKLGVLKDSSVKSVLKISADEGKTLKKFCDKIVTIDENIELLDGYYVGYSINQIGKEFDLLRFCDEAIINIELKSKLADDVKEQKITKQLHQNYYYLKFLNKPLYIYSFVENDELYKYNPINNIIEECPFEELINVLNSYSCNPNLNPDEIFKPSHYLISPFNKTERFMNSEYFLTPQQEDIKNEVIKSIAGDDNKWFCISANAGTGKTLLLYDLIKTLCLEGLNTLTIHCGKLNEGHLKLIADYNWKIYSIRDIFNSSIDRIITKETKAIFVDESQRINHTQLEMIVEKALEYNIPLIFSYDIKQFLKSGENTDIYEYLKKEYPNSDLIKRNLTNKIRTNKEMSSFITNLFNIGKSQDNLNYENITIEYVNSYTDAKKLANNLQSNGWKVITFTSSRYSREYIDNLASICETKAHDVIGQEFEKVVLFMDDNFRYSENGRLQAIKNYYSARGMLYQIATRVMSQLKIIVIRNPELYHKLLIIKGLGNR